MQYTPHPYPEAVIVVSGDFNRASLDYTFPVFHQFYCITRDSKTLDLLYVNVKEAYGATALLLLGCSHNMVFLTPQYLPAVPRLPVSTMSVMRWSREASEALQDCFDTTDWDVLCMSHGEDVGSFMDCITVYINFC